MSKYKLLRTFNHYAEAGRITAIPCESVSINYEDGMYWFPYCGGVSAGIPKLVVENNPGWFEKVEEPIIKEGEMYYFINLAGKVSSRIFEPIIDDRERLRASNCFPEKSFTESEVQAIADEVTALFKKHQQSKQQ